MTKTPGPGAPAPSSAPLPVRPAARTLLRVTLWTLGALLLAGGGALEAQSGDGGDSKSVRDGVYSAEQADEGEYLFGNVCAACHVSSQFRGTSFVNTWNGTTVFRLYDQISATMPFDNPGGLPPVEYAAIVAYMLELNGYPAGDYDLPSSREELDRIRIVRP